MAVIELGLVTDGEPAPRDPGPPVAPGTTRRLLAAAVAVFCLLALAGSALPRPHGVATLWSLPLDAEDHSYSTSADTLFFLDAAAEKPVLTAYDLRTGAVRWRTATTGDWIWPPGPAADVLLLPSTPHDTDAPYLGAALAAVDARTGEHLWQQRGDLLEASAELVLLLDWADGSGMLRAVRLRDGGTAWSRAAPGGAGWAQVLADAGTGRVVTLAGAGRIDVYAYADGSPAGSRTVPWTTRPPDGWERPESTLRLVADTLLVQRDDPGREAQVTAYDAATLAERWRLALPAYSGLTDCGALLCVYAGSALAGYDRATGERRWQLRDSVNAVVLGSGRLLVEDDAANFPGRRLLDATTGRTVAELGDARPVQDPRTGDVTPFFLAPTREPAGLTSIRRLDDRTGRLVLLGATEPILDTACLAEHAVLVCPTGGGRLIVVTTGRE